MSVKLDVSLYKIKTALLEAQAQGTLTVEILDLVVELLSGIDIRRVVEDNIATRAGYQGCVLELLKYFREGTVRGPCTVWCLEVNKIRTLRLAPGESFTGTFFAYNQGYYD